MSASLRVLILLAMLLGLSACSEPPYTNLTNETLKEALTKDIPIYDIRRKDEWRKTGIIEGSEMLTFVDNSGRLNPDFFPEFTKKINKDDPVILICRTGNRSSALATHLMEKMGYTHVLNVRDGISWWIHKQGPVVSMRGS